MEDFKSDLNVIIQPNERLLERYEYSEEQKEVIFFVVDKMNKSNKPGEILQAIKNLLEHYKEK